MQVKLIKRAGTWADVYEAALFTVGKTSLGILPNDVWKEKILTAEHSPIRLLWFTFEIKEIPVEIPPHTNK